MGGHKAFFFRPQQENVRFFHSSNYSASEVTAILKKFVSKEASLAAAILKMSWQPGRVYVTSLRPKLATDLTSFTTSTKSI